MRVYNAMWSLVVVCLAALGTTEALLVVAPLTLWCAGMALAVLASLFCLAFVVVASPGRSSISTVALAGAVGATLGVVTAGLAALLGGGAGVLLVVLAGVHPRVLHRAARRTQGWLRSGAGTAATTAAARQGLAPQVSPARVPPAENPQASPAGSTPEPDRRAIPPATYNPPPGHITGHCPGPVVERSHSTAPPATA